MTLRQQAWTIIAGSFFVLGLLLILKWLMKPPPVCDPDVKSKTVILIDHSEKIAVQTADAIVERAWQMIENEVAVGERVSVFNLTALSRNDLRPVFSSCKPRSEASPLFADPHQVARAFEERFKKPLREILASRINGSAASPIAQGIIDLSLDRLRFESPRLTRLMVFSDLMEHTPEFSLYGCDNPKEAIGKFRASRVGATERPRFRNADIRLQIIPRRDIGRGVLQCRDHFWMWFFGDTQGRCNGEVCVNPEHLPG